MEKDLIIKKIKNNIENNKVKEALTLIEENIVEPSIRSNIIKIINSKGAKSNPLSLLKCYDVLFGLAQSDIKKALIAGVQAYQEASQQNLLANKETIIKLEKLYREIFDSIYKATELYDDSLSLIKEVSPTVIKSELFHEFIINMIIVVEKNYQYLMKTPNVRKLAHLENESILALAWDMVDFLEGISTFYLDIYGNNTLKYPKLGAEFLELKISEVMNLNNVRHNILNARLMPYEKELSSREKIFTIIEKLDTGDQFLCQGNYHNAYSSYNDSKIKAQEGELERLIFWASYKIVGNCYAELYELYEKYKNNQDHNIFEQSKIPFYNLLKNAGDVTNYLLQQSTYYFGYNFDQPFKEVYVNYSFQLLEALVNSFIIEEKFGKKSEEFFSQYKRSGLDIMIKLLNNLVVHKIEEVELNLLGKNIAKYNVKEYLENCTAKLKEYENLILSPIKSEPQEITQKSKKPLWQQKIAEGRLAEKTASTGV
ncbi:hypothetical protein NOVO_08705 [Rickettsiales bacterium Ac37b]|nr:hypothetical protein NOVO_08705 [Rickettsiales bacterium Ac37b]